MEVMKEKTKIAEDVIIHPGHEIIISSVPNPLAPTPL